MERNEINTICRLCLSENGNLIYVFESREIHGWTPADAINELLRIQVSADDIYPQCVCIECMGKLDDFKVFKDRCETCKELLDRAYAAKRGTGRNEEFIEGTSSFMENHCEVYLKEEDPNIILEKDPLELTEEDKPIKLENENCVFVSNEWASREEIESANDSYMSDKNEDEDTEVALETESKYLPSSLSLTALGTNEETNGDCINVLEVSDNWCLKEELVDMPDEVDSVELLAEREHQRRASERQSCNIFANEMTQNAEGRSTDSHCLPNRNESPNSHPTLKMCSSAASSSYSLGCSNVAGEVVTLSVKQENVDILHDDEECSRSSGNEFDIVPSGLPTTNKGLIISSSDCCQSYSALQCLPQPELMVHGIPQHVIPTSISRRGNICRDVKDCRNNEDKSRSIPIGVKDPLHLHMQTTAIENEVEGARFTVIPFPKNPKEVDSEEKQSTKAKINSCTESNAGSKLNRSSSKKVVQAQAQVRKMVVNETGCKLKGEVCSKIKKRKKERLEESLEENESNFRCNYCGVVFDVKEHLRDHIESHIGGELCQSKTSFGSGAVGRSLLVDTIKSTPRKRVKKLKSKGGSTVYECEFCKRKFNKGGNLKVHRRLHTGERPFKCGECKRTFSQKIHLNTHLKIHNCEKPYVCDTCGRGYTEGIGLKRHLEIHAEVNTFLCEVCGKRFRTKYLLNTHFKIHTGELPCCAFCGMHFRYKAALMIHLRSHTGEKPYECGGCHKRFRYKTGIRQHLKNHESCRRTESGKWLAERRGKHRSGIRAGGRNFKCDVCHKDLRNESNLRRHIRIHTGESPFGCSDCGKKFNQKANLKRHIKKTHGLEVPHV